MTKVLIVDDEQDMLILLKRIIAENFPCEINAINDPTQVARLLAKNRFDMVFTDLKMPVQDGIQVLQTVKEKYPDTVVVIITAYGTIDSAIEATRKGAFDYITKPFRKKSIVQTVEQAFKWQGLQRENVYLREKLEGASCYLAIIGNSLPMQRVFDQIRNVADTTATILITGESGTGKELAARAIHAQSSRKGEPFVTVNCSAVPESLIESELFGHMKGSFTGAFRDKKGLVEEADHGTLFLDEAGDLSLVTQVKLLRLLQEGEFKVVGDNRTRRVDIRFVSATNQNLEAKIKKGEFREDLYYRLNVINVHLPSLRERVDDIPLLAQHFLKKYSILNKKDVAKFSKDAMDYLIHRDWPGNIRELENVIERGVIMAGSDVMQLSELVSPRQGLGPVAAIPSGSTETIFVMPFKEAKDKLIEEFEVQYITKALTRHAGNVSRAAEESGLKRQYLHRLMREQNLDSRIFKKTISSKKESEPEER